MPINAPEIRGLLQTAVNALNANARYVIQEVAMDIYSFSPPPEFQDLLEKIEGLMRTLNQGTENIPPELLPCLKRAILDARLNLANQLEVSRASVSDPATVEKLDRHLEPYDQIMKDDWFQRTEPARIPGLSDFLTIERSEFHLKDKKLQERLFDEKFHVLQAPTLFLPDLDYYRKKCGLRNLPVAVAYLDIDKFKDFNSRHGETFIDRNLLPRFMAALEAHVYARGFAYRFGGDEYAVLLPNTDSLMAENILAGFQDKLKGLTYQGIDQRTTVSIGFCEVKPNSHFTNQEFLHLAEVAKNFAKTNGRNCVATYVDSLYKVPGLLNRSKNS
jgi:diguanylate cyclase (GGDEF)-like protein